MKRPWLLPFTPLWAAGAAWKNRAFDRHPAKAQHLQRPVISVGSLSAGGAGKTPFVIALGHALQHSGIPVDVLSRGYGRTIDATTAKRVDATGAPDDFGDEPLLIARALNAPVYVASQRIDAGRLAEAGNSNSATVHLLDDGFQHRQLARAADIVLLTEQDIHDTLLPAGDLREPLSSLRRASILVLRSEEAAAIRPLLKRLVPTAAQPHIWEIERRFTVDEPPQRPFAFCGIARPENFRTALEARGITPVGFAALHDHQRYNAAIIHRLVHRAKRAGADGFLTTAKDAVKLSAGLHAALEAVGPVAVADITVRLTDEQRCMQTLKQMLADVSFA